ncbi:hypothetical protein Skr01_63650 [Sphaerisporangium krabiense]|uniref:Cytochrome bd-type quinol oxidase subunit 2 n=1 Tax=Sphaerisporangium krabiense TaxID=763782 RepID=A0A7W9DRM9_9ACTN|nr:DUF998 domain-containing protein [Sphaerisporangium krabiense]MBB5628284.1 cytochrome bd-type quinol oxidase subunit 2 [Sphaerisporangium krabiense]GII66280.1 hypothetical protein Skr01_63650 [Sphaerisporangium krabiense]
MNSRLTAGGFAALFCGAAAMAALHVVSDLDPLRGMISEYAYHPNGWLLPVSLTLLAVGSALFAVDMARRNMGRPAALLLGGWSVCMLLIGAFPTDAPGMSLSMSGGIHRYAAFAAFVCMPAAGLVVAARGGRHARALRALSFAAGVFLVLVLVPYAMRMVGLDPGAVPAGLTQRMVVVTEVVILALVGLTAVTGRGRRPAAARAVVQDRPVNAVPQRV